LLGSRSPKANELRLITTSYRFRFVDSLRVEQVSIARLCVWNRERFGSISPRVPAAAPWMPKPCTMLTSAGVAESVDATDLSWKFECAQGKPET
jgi:hypothetical protein